MPTRHRPGVRLYAIYIRVWEGGKNSNDSEREMDSTESIAGAVAIHLWLAQPECSSDANGYCVQALAYADIA